VFQLIAVGIVYLLFLGAGSEIGFAEVCLIAAITGVAGILPLAIKRDRGDGGDDHARRCGVGG